VWRMGRSGVAGCRRHLRVWAVALLAVCLAAGVAAGDVAAKKKKGKASVFAGSASPNLAVPDAPGAGAHETIVTSAITVPKKFKGKVVGDLNITGVKTTGSAATAADGLDLMLVAPGGPAVLFDAGALNGQSISFCASPPCTDPDATLTYPYAGTTNLAFTFGGDTGPLSAFNGTSMRGVWTLYAWDNDFDGSTNIVNTWGLKITAAKAVRR
jgi:hypothetical protein